MEPQPPVTAPQPTPPLVPPKPKNNNFLIILLSVLLLLATSLAFFFALQTQKLAKQLAQYQLAIPSPTPTATPDETANLSRDEVLRDWKTYTNTRYNYSVQYPSTWKVKKIEAVEGIETVWLTSTSTHKPTSTVKNLEIIIGSPLVYSTSGALCANQWCEDINPFPVTITNKSYSTKVIRASVGPDKKFERYSFQIDKLETSPLAITGTYFTETEQKEIISLLSTFKFTE